jgi:hypothetical protein
MKKWVAILSLSFLIGVPSKNTRSGFMPKPDHEINIPVDESEGISEGEFNNILKNFKAVYTPIVKDRGYTLVLRNKWADTTVNSDTTVSGSSWVINAYGGLARFKGMNPDAYMMVLCHEVGHHLGGAPKYPNNRWASNEGASDYFASLKCFRRLADAGALPQESNQPIPATVSKKCSKVKNPALCERSSMAGFVLAQVLNDLQENPVPVSFDTPDPKQVSQTSHSHPKAQCRLDTMFAGALCDNDYRKDLSDSDPNENSCSSGDGARPRCWYAPKPWWAF